MNETAAPEKRRRSSSAVRQQEIVAAVVELARESGPDGITTQAIAERVGLTHGALFRHFPDKQAIWAAVFDWVREALSGIVDSAFAAGGSPLALLERVFHAHVDFVARHPGVPRMLFHELQRPADSAFHERVRQMVRGYRQRLCAAIAEAKRAGELRPGLDDEAAATLFIGTVQGLAVQANLFRGETDMRQVGRRLWPLLLDGWRGADT